MEITLEILKHKEIVEKLIANFPSIDEYYKFHDYIKKSGVKFEIQEYHDLIIVPLKHSENEAFATLLSEYCHIDPKILEVYEKFISVCIDDIFKKNALIETSNMPAHQKASSLNLISNSISGAQIQLGGNPTANPILAEITQNIEAHAEKYRTPSSKLNPKFESYFYEEMLRSLAEEKMIDDDFLDKQNRFEWVHYALFFGDKNQHLKSSIQYLNWQDSLTTLADFLMFLFSNLIEYDLSDKKEFYTWMVCFVRIKGEPIIKNSTRYRSLKRIMKKHKNDPSVIFRINNLNLFEIGYFVTRTDNFK